MNHSDGGFRLRNEISYSSSNEPIQPVSIHSRPVDSMYGTPVTPGSESPSATR